MEITMKSDYDIIEIKKDNINLNVLIVGELVDKFLFYIMRRYKIHNWYLSSKISNF